MFHSGTQSLINCWLTLSKAGQAPRRTDFSPVLVPELAPRLFLVDRTRGEPKLRLAGEFVEALHGRQVKGRALSDLWRTQSRPLVHRTALRAVREVRPFVISAEGPGRYDDALRIEVLLAPLAGADGAIERLLGLYQPTGPAGFEAGPEFRLTARLAAAAGPASGRPELRLASSDGRRTA